MNKNDNRKLIVISLALCLLSSVFFLFYQYQINSNRKMNYINNSYLNLDNHIYFSSHSSHKIVLLGSSAASGNNIPINTTITDYLNEINDKKQYFFNMGLMEATLVDSLAILSKLQDDPPKKIIYALNPGNFRRLYGRFSIKHKDKARDYLTPKINRILEHQAKIKFSGPFSSFFGKLNIPSPLLLKSASALYFLKQKLFGPQFNKIFFQYKSSNAYNLKNIISQIELFVRMSKIMDADIFFYYEPIILKNKLEEQAYNIFLAKTKKYLKDQGISYMDYSHHFKKSPNNFIDFVHLTPRGNKLVASELYKELDNGL